MAIKVSKVKQRSSDRLTSLTGKANEARASFGWAVDDWLQLQAELFGAAAPALLGWIDRRCAASGAILKAAGKLMTCQNPEELTAIHTEWLAGSLERLEHDLHAAAEHAATVTQSLTGAAQRAVGSSQETVQGNAGWIVRKVETPSSTVISAVAPETAASPTEAVWQAR